MAKTLAQWRRQRRVDADELAALAGVSAERIEAVENGQRLHDEERTRLANALGISPHALVDRPARSSQRPKGSSPRGNVRRGGTGPSNGRKERPKRAGRAAVKPPQPARPSQLEHLRQLGRKLGQSSTDIADRINKPLDDLTRAEATKWLNHYSKLIADRKADMAARHRRRQRASLPETLDRFERDYLEERRQNSEQLRFVLFDGSALTGSVKGYSRYSITVCHPDGSETTIQKLAIAYYSLPAESMRHGGGDSA